MHQDAGSTKDTDLFKRYYYVHNQANLSTRYESDHKILVRPQRY